MSTHHMSKKLKPNDDTNTSMVMLEYIGEGVTDNVTHVRFHPNVVDVTIRQFEALTELREVILNDGLREIGLYAFLKCKVLQSINIPSTVTKIGNFAFSGCTELKEVVLNEGLTEIGVHLFQSCTSLRSITTPSTITDIGLHAFSGCTNLREVVLNDGIKRIKECAFEECTSLERIVIPSTVVEIGKKAFLRCSSLREVVIQYEGVQIRDDTFRACTSLERFKFPSHSRLDGIIQAGQRGIEAKINDIPAVEWRGGELTLPVIRRKIKNQWGGVHIVAEVDEEKLDKIVRLIRYYEIKEATTLFELALWKAKMNQVHGSLSNRGICRVEVPGPVKDAILQFLSS